MKALGTPREIDPLGRITIPIELRKRYGLQPGTQAEIIATTEGVVLRSYTEPCPIMEEIHRLNAKINEVDISGDKKIEINKHFIEVAKILR